MNAHEQELIGDAIAAENVRLLLAGKLKGRPEPGTLARSVQMLIQSLLLDPEPTRGTGETSRQMVNAPKGALFVWDKADLRYPCDLAIRLGRGDLRIIAKADLIQHLRGRVSVATEVDHATQLTDEQWNAVKLARRGLLI